MFDTTDPHYLLREASSHDAMTSSVTTLKPTRREGPKLVESATSNAPAWMWIALAAWVVCAYPRLRLAAVDTYQAIWGPDTRHPAMA